MLSHQVQFVIPAKSGIRRSAALGTGFRRCDGGLWALCTQVKGRLNIMAFKYCLDLQQRGNLTRLFHFLLKGSA